MKVGSMLQETVIACTVLAVLAVLSLGLAGHVWLGVGFGAGLILGSGNGYLIVAVLERGAPFVAGSLARLALITTLALGAAVMLGGPAWPLLAGAGLAQMVMVAAGIRRGLRAS